MSYDQNDFPASDFIDLSVPESSESSESFGSAEYLDWDVAEQFANLVGQADELLRMLRSSVMTAKSKL